MKEAGIELFEYLIGSLQFASVMGTRLFPLMATGETLSPYSIYGMYRELISQDGEEITFTLFVYFEPGKYDECIDFIDKIKPIIEQKYQWLNDTIEVVENTLEYSGIITFKT